jgi:hypothetical protein
MMTIIRWLSRGGRLFFGIALGAIAVLFNHAIGLARSIFLFSASELFEEEKEYFPLYGSEALVGVISGVARSLQQAEISVMLSGKSGE